MKNIQVTDEQYAFLINLSKELHTQDGRMTQDPLFVVRETLKEWGIDSDYHTDGFEWIRDGEECDEDYMWECVEEYNWTETNIPFDFTLEEVEDHKELRKNRSLDDFEYSGLFDDNFTKCYYRNIYRYSGAFLTAKACESYIQQNKHNLHEPISYGMSFYRNPEMINLREILMSLNQ